MPNTITDTITELADNKSDIQDALVAKGITSAGKHGFGKFAEDIVSIANQYTSSDEGKVVSGGALIAQTSTTATANGTINTTTNNEVAVNVPNTYTAGDEGKVVSGGALVAQTAYPTTITDNGTYDTTKNNSVTVSVPSLPSGIGIAKLTAISTNIENSDMYIVNDILNNRVIVFGRCKRNATGTTPFTFTYPASFIPIVTSKWSSYLYANYGTGSGLSSSSADTTINTADNTVNIITPAASITEYYFLIAFKP